MVCVFFTHTILAAKLTGKVVDENNEPLPYVTIKIKGKELNTFTDFDGKYEIELSEQSTVVFSFIGYNTQEYITDGGIYDLKMVPTSLKIDEVEIISKKNNSSEAVLVLDKKELVGVESSIGSVELAKKGISNAQDGLKKVTGVTFLGSRINVRGLDDRYNQVTLNGLPIPSNNSDVKNINLSILPVSLMENMKVKKSYSSDQWSNIGGAQINLLTKDIRNVFDVSLRSGVNTLTNGLNNNLSIQYGNNKSKKFGYHIGLTLINNNQYTGGFIKLVNKQGNDVLNYNFTQLKQDITPSVFTILSYKKNNLNFKNTTLFLSQTNNTNLNTDGNHFDYEKKIKTIRISPSTHTLFLNQFAFDYKRDNLLFDGLLGYSNVISGENNREQYVFLYDSNYRFNNIDKLDNHLFSSQNKENRFNLSLNGTVRGETIEHRFGLVSMVILNNFDYQQQYYDLGLVNSYYNNLDPNQYQTYIQSDLTKTLRVNNPSSNVNGLTLINGGYYMFDYKSDKIDLSFGSRLENAYQKVSYRDQLSPVFLRSNVLNNYEVLPYVNSKFKINKTTQIKTTSSITTIRPRFREMTPFIYTEVFAGSKIQGNPNLVNSTILNNDLIFEYYPSRNEMFIITFYSKFIQKPIERVNVATASGRLETYQNSDKSNVYGIEFELKKKINSFNFDYNLSYLQSTINILDSSSSSVVVTNFDRPLQGSTPILSNFDIFYDVTKTTNVGLTYNYSGKKLNSVGIYGLGDVYQSAQHQLNFVYNFKSKKTTLSIRINNILNTPYVLKQETDIGSIEINKYRTGVNFSLSGKYNF